METNIQKQANLYNTQLKRMYGTRLDDLTWQEELAERPQLQHQRVCDVVEGSQRFLYMVANDLLSGRVMLMKNSPNPISLASSGLENSELVGVANKHLIERFSRYDPKYKVLTFIGLYARGAMFRQAGKLTGIVDIPHGITQKVNGKGYEKIATELQGRKHRVGETTPAERAAIIVANQWGHADLFARVNDDDNKTVEEVHAEDPESIARIMNPAEWDQMERDLHDSMGYLTDRERQVLEQRFWEDKELHEIGAEMGLTRERVRQIEIKALRQLRHDFWQISGMRSHVL